MNQNRRSIKGAATLPPLDSLQQQRTLDHLTLAQRLAWKYFQSCAQTVPLDEMRGEALYALVYAAGMFDDTRGVPFGAYATMAISHRLIQLTNAWRRGGRQAATRFTDLTATTNIDFDTPCPRTRESKDQAALRETMDRLRRVLPPRWFSALHLYYAQGHTLEEVGQRLGVTRERVRQLLTKAVERRARERWHEIARSRKLPAWDYNDIAGDKVPVCPPSKRNRVSTPKKYYVLLYDLRDHLASVADYEMDDFDLTHLWTGKKLTKPIPETVKVLVDDGLPCDYLGNPISWKIVSKRLAKRIAPFAGVHVQFIPITLFSARTNRRINRYMIANPLGCVNAIKAKGRKTNVSIDQLILRADRIPKNRHIFRLKHQETRVVISQQLFDALANKSLTGLAARPIEAEREAGWT